MGRVFSRIAAWFDDVVDLVAPLPAPEENIDVHCHLFNLNTALIYLMKGAIDVSARMLAEGSTRAGGAAGDAAAPGETPPAAQPQDLAARSQEFLGYLRAALVWLSSDSRKVYRYLRRRGGYRFTLVALSLDFDYHADAAARDRFRAYFEKAMERLRPQLEKAGGPFARETSRLLAKFGDRIAACLDARLWSIDFYEQAEQLARVARKYGGVYPFLAVDPRQPGILDYVKKRVGAGKDFRGVKIYCPMGYSPTDPLLFGRDGNDDCLYGYCVSNAIPVTTHCSPKGFGTAADQVPVRGHIYVARGESVIVNDMPVTGDGPVEVDGVLRFKANFPAANHYSVFQERSHVLNHPMIWGEVLRRYPDLRLDLAHFGEDAEMEQYVRDAGDNRADASKSWTKAIACLTDAYENVYTDLACNSNYDVLRRMKTVLWDRGFLSDKVKSKVMYGSDWDVLLFLERDLNRYVSQFREIFGSEFDALSIANPRRFLGL